MKYMLKSVCFCLALCGAAACGNDTEPPVLQGSGEAVILNAQIEQPSLCRTSMDADHKTTMWTVGDKVCLHGTATVPQAGGGGNKEMDLGPGIYQYQTDGSWIYTDGGTQPIIWRAATIKVSGVFPAFDTRGNKVTTEAFTLATDQQTAIEQGKNDYMVADETEQTETDGKQIALTFKHQLAQLAITIASIGTEHKDATITKVEVRSQTVLSGTTWATPANITSCGAANGTKNDTYIALVAPEAPNDISIANPFIKVTLSNGTQVKLSTLPAQLTFEKGKQHTLALHVGHDEITVDASSISIGDWGADTNVTGGNPGDTEEE